MTSSDPRVLEITLTLPGKNCGQCGYPNCAQLAEVIARDPEARQRCVYLNAPETMRVVPPAVAEEPWKDVLGREFDMVLEPFPDDPGPREHILPFNPLLAERLQLRMGDTAYGRPAGVGCPVTHVGRVMAPPDPLSGSFVWCIVGPAVGRAAAAREIGGYHIIAYEGMVRRTRVAPQVGGRYYFKPAYCMLQSRHSGVVSFAARGADGWRVRLEGITIA
jgi:uncharacterized protein